MNIYIAGAITNNPNYKEQFKNAEIKLKKLGYTPLNPCKSLGFTYKQYIDMGLCQLMQCDGILMVGDWETSVGALLELSYAKSVGLIILYENKLETPL